MLAAFLPVPSASGALVPAAQNEPDGVRCQVSLNTSGFNFAKLFYCYEAVLLQKV